MPKDAAASPRRGRPYASLRGQAEFARVYRAGSRRRAGGVLVVSAPGGEGSPRVGVVAGRRVGGAVVRNRVKRRLREALARVELADGTAYVVVASSEVADAAFDDIVGWVKRAVRPEPPEVEEEV